MRKNGYVAGLVLMPYGRIEDFLTFDTFSPFLFDMVGYEQLRIYVFIFLQYIGQIIRFLYEIEIELLIIGFIKEPYDDNSFTLLRQTEIKCVKYLSLHLITQLVQSVKDNGKGPS